MSGKATMEQTDKFYKNTRRQGPSFSMAGKPEMIVGGNVPSWTKSIPGPKYDINTDAYKPRAPATTMGIKPEMVIGGNVPSWTNSIPGPKYVVDVNVVRPRQPVYTMGGGRATTRKSDGFQKSGQLQQAALRLTDGFKATTKSTPAFSIKSRTEFIVGGDVPSWKQSIPGPYTCDPDVVKPKQPVFSLGRRLPTESDLMKSRSPGPMNYGGAAVDAKKQAEVDSTKKRTLAPSFGSLPRWEGLAADMARTGASARYEKPVIRRS